MDEMVYNKNAWRRRILVCTATEGWIRYEWAHARFGQVIPVNWAAIGFDVFTAMQFSIDDAYNIITKKALELGVEWVLMIEDDVLIPPDCFLKMADYMDSKKYPVVSGLYYTKSEPAVPLLFRGRGNGAFHDWTLGDKVNVDGLPMGCLLIHTSLLQWVWDNSPEYIMGNGEKSRKVFETPRRVFYDPEKGIETQQGTQDLFFFDRVIDNKVLDKIGWEVEDKANPFLCDTSIFCRHIDRNTGRQYP